MMIMWRTLFASRIKNESPPASRVLLYQDRIDNENNNSFQVWKDMGSTQDPSPEQILRLERAGQLQLFTSPKWISTKDGVAVIKWIYLGRAYLF